MRALSTSLLIVVVSLTTLNAQDELHNYVAVKPGIYLSVTDAENPRTLSELLHDESLDSDKPLIVFAFNDTSNKARLLLLNDDNYLFSFQLYDSKSNRIVKSSLGTSKSFVPANIITGGGKLRPLPIGPRGDVIVAELPSVKNLFRISEPGHYIFDLRLRYCTKTNTAYSWSYSQHIRLPVKVAK